VEVEPLLAWYRPRHRRYPWRHPRPDPYHVLVSEFMLQQTQAARVALSFRSFLERFPTVRALAAAPRREVLRAWAGLGYNRRAVALSQAARRIVSRHDGTVPSEPDILVDLPGVGPYTAAAVASIAFGARLPAVDTNVRRVVARAALGVDGPEAKPAAVRVAACEWMGGADPGVWNQAVMDLGREICRPTPRCDRCPLSAWCSFRLAGRAPAVRRRGATSPFDGSTRQLRGAIVRILGRRESATVAQIARETSQPLDRLVRAVAGLADEGLVAAGPAALAGRPRGRVRLPD
jgi:A/G-specific adenine glycosylase